MPSASYNIINESRRKSVARFGAGLPLYLLSAFFTALIFIGLPFLERLARPPAAASSLRTVDTVAVPVLPQPPKLHRPIEKYKNPLPKPQLAQATPLLQPLPPAIDLTMVPVEPQGSFNVDFDVRDADLVQQVGALVFEMGELDDPPQAQACMHPVYPPRARMRRQEGFVEVEFVVNAEGSTEDVQITESVPPHTFDQATRRAVQGWRFKPGMKNGEPVATRVRQKISFSLE